METLLFLNTVGLLGLRLRYWLIIIVIIVIVAGLAFFARNRSV